jgi:hypothetical protein
MAKISKEYNEPKNESKTERFIRIAESRTNKIIDMVRLLGNLSNKAVYDYEKDDIEKIFRAIDIEIKQAKAKFAGFEADEKFKLR